MDDRPRPLGEILTSISPKASTGQLTTERTEARRKRRHEIAVSITRLTIHYWTPSDLPKPMRDALTEDWLEDLEEFPAGMVHDACREWRQSVGKRPNSHDIRAICVARRKYLREMNNYIDP